MSNDDKGWGDDWGPLPNESTPEQPAPTPPAPAPAPTPAPGPSPTLAEQDDAGLAATQALEPITGPASPAGIRGAQPPAFAEDAPALDPPLPPDETAPTTVMAAPTAPAPTPTAPVQEPTALAPIASPSPTDLSNITLDEIEAGKSMALFCHLANMAGIPLWVLPLFIQKDNDFTIFHAKQAAAGTAVFWAASAAISVIGSITCGIGFILVLALPVIGIWPAIWAHHGKLQKLPVVGDLAEDVFKGIKKEVKG